jgi:hypothetical protein
MMLAQNAPAKSTSAPAAIPNPASAIGPQFEVASVRQNLTLNRAGACRSPMTA